MKYIKISVVLVALITFSCQSERTLSDPEAFEFEITIEGLEGNSRWFLEQPVANRGNMFVDTLDLVDGKLLYKGKTAYPKLSKLRSFEKKGTLVFMLTPGIHSIKAKYADMEPKVFNAKFEYVPYESSKNSDQETELLAFRNSNDMQRFKEKENAMNKWVDSTFETIYGISKNVYGDMAYSKDTTKRKALKQILSKIDRSALEVFHNEQFEKKKAVKQLQEEATINFLKANPDSYVALFYILENVFMFSSPPTEANMKRYLPYFGASLKDTNEYDHMLNKYEAEVSSAKGKVALDFESETPEGKLLKLSDLKGKVVLVDFWASWCSWCRKETPNLKEQYAKYKDHGFEILSVSFDTKRERWEKAIEEDQMPWLQTVDFSGLKESEIAKKYGVNSIPFMMLIDKEGRVVAKNVRQPSIAKSNNERNLNLQLKTIFGF